MKTLVALVAVAISIAAAPVSAQQAGAGVTKPAATDASATTDAEVRRIDKARGSVVLKHGEIKNLNMGAMTMTFKLQDPAMAEHLAAGDKVQFTAIQKGDDLIVTSIRKAQ